MLKINERQQKKPLQQKNDFNWLGCGPWRWLGFGRDGNGDMEENVNYMYVLKIQFHANS